MITIKVPDIEELPTIIVRLDEPRIITYKDDRKSSNNKTTFVPLNLKDYKNICGVYLFLINGSVKYIGATNDLFTRMIGHSFLLNNPSVKSIKFFEVKNKKNLWFFELVYKYNYFGVGSIEYFKH